MIVTFVGDVHANIVALHAAFEEAKRVEAEALIQVGDFGYWPNFGTYFLRQTRNLYHEYGIPIHFVDGNHEDHSVLGQYTEETRLQDGLIYHPRGTVTVLGDSRVLWFGGAQSIDAHLRKAGKNWFSNESHSPAQLARAYEAAAEPVDVMVTHESPLGPPLRGLDLDMMGTPEKDRLRASRVRREIDALLRFSGAHLHVHGHWHEFAITYGSETKVVSLAADRAAMTGRIDWFTYTADL